MKTVQALIEELLTAKRESTREEAADELGKRGAEASEAVGALLTALEEKGKGVSLRAANALGELGEVAETAIPKLFEKVVTGDRSSFLASRAINLIGEAGITFLLLQLRGGDVRNSVAAAYCLYNYGYLQERVSQPDLTQTILHSAEDVAESESSQELRVAAALVVGALLSNPAVRFDPRVDLTLANERLLTHMCQPRFGLALTCSVTLGRMGVAAVPSVPALIGAILKDEWWQPYAVEVLKHIDDLASQSGYDVFDSPDARSALGEQTIADVRKSFDAFSECYSRGRMVERARRAKASLVQESHADGVEIIGVYPVRTKESVHLVELVVSGSTGMFDVGKFGQTITRPASRQVAYDEKFLEEDGVREVTDSGLDWPDKDNNERWKGDVRLAFFLHNVDFGQKLDTPFASIELPEPVSRPKRLRFIKYRSP